MHLQDLNENVYGCVGCFIGRSLDNQTYSGTNMTNFGYLSKHQLQTF